MDDFYDKWEFIIKNIEFGKHKPMMENATKLHELDKAKLDQIGDKLATLQIATTNEMNKALFPNGRGEVAENLDKLINL